MYFMYFEALIQDISPIEAMEYTKYMKPTPNKNHVPGAAGGHARPSRNSSPTKPRRQTEMDFPALSVSGQIPRS